MAGECGRIAPLLERWLDAQAGQGDIGRDEAAAVAAHLGACPACRAEAQAERRLRAALGALPVLSCPPAVARRIADLPLLEPAGRNRGRRAWAQGRPRSWLIVPAAAAAVAFALLAGAPGLERLRELAGGRPQAAAQAPPVGRTPGAVADLSAARAPEAAAARAQAVQGLAIALRIMNESERRALAEVFGRELPSALGAPLRRLSRVMEGERG